MGTGADVQPRRTVHATGVGDPPVGQPVGPGLLHLPGAEGADIAKIACKVHSERDNIRLLGLLDREKSGGELVVVGMGEQGRITRIVAPFLGSPFTYASLAEGKETAVGQVSKNKLENIMRLIREI